MMCGCADARCADLHFFRFIAVVCVRDSSVKPGLATDSPAFGHAQFNKVCSQIQKIPQMICFVTFYFAARSCN